jgi:acyl-coenzyme A synthetase/AMP-(fatty) acid ligase
MIAMTRNSITLSAVFLLPCTALYWLLTTPNVIGGPTYIALSVLALATSVIAFNTWRNVQSTGSLPQFIHETDMGPAMSPAVAVAPATTRAPRWDRRARITRAGQARALVALGALASRGLLSAWVA